MFKWKDFSILFVLTAAVFAVGCGTESSGGDDAGLDNGEYRKAMREFVIDISRTARTINPDFLIIPQNGQEVAWDSDEAVDLKLPYDDYLAAIDGIGREDLFYGYDVDNKATKKSDYEYLCDLCDVYKNAGKTVLVTDYCSSIDKISDSFNKNGAKGYVSFAAPNRDLNIIPENETNYGSSGFYPAEVNSGDVKKLSDSKNFLYYINPECDSREEYLQALSETNYDLLLIDLFFDDSSLTKSEVDRLKVKANGGKRLVICYMSIGEAEDYRWYWNSAWGSEGEILSGAPDWLSDENPDWGGNYKVKYWDIRWQEIILAGKNSYLSKILEAGFDGVYLDIIDAYEYFEGEN